jgi:CubicO group peptidase (beta-lactamase class C family)
MNQEKGSAMKSLALAVMGAMAIASMTGCGTAGPEPSAAGALPRALEGSIRSAMRKQGIVGMSAIAVSGDRRILAKGYGYADRSRKIPVTVDTVFPLASITKLFTATAVMQLVERGDVDLDSPVSRYLPRVARSGSPVSDPTVRQLLTHHSGLQGNIMEGFELKEPDPIAYRDVPRLLAGFPPVSRPDTVFAYCNAGYSLLGCLVEEVSGTDYADFVDSRILEPLGMSRTRFLLTRADVEGAAMGYDGRTPVPVYPMRDIPAGALLSTAMDMEKFMRFVLEHGRDGVLGREAFAEMIRRQNAQVALDGDFSIGLGYWLIKPFDVEDAFASHAGDIPPFHTVLVTIPDQRIGVFLAANSSRDPTALIPLAVELVRAVYAEQSGEPVDDPPLPPKVRLDRTVLDSLAGKYASPLGLMDLRARGGKLLARVGGVPIELVPRTDGSFTAELSLLGLLSVPVPPLKKVRFSRVENGDRTYLRITTLGIMAGIAERLPLADVPQAWRSRAGRYAIVPRGANASYRWPRDISLEFDSRSGLLLLSYTFAGQRAPFPLLAMNDAEAVIAGTGTGLGDTINAREESGEIFLEWAGLLLKRE